MNYNRIANALTSKIVEAETEYQKYFQKVLKKFKVKSPGELEDKDKKKFFKEVDDGWESADEKGKKGSSIEAAYNSANLNKVILAFVEFIAGNSAQGLSDLVRYKTIEAVDVSEIPELERGMLSAELASDLYTRIKRVKLDMQNAVLTRATNAMASYIIEGPAVVIPDLKRLESFVSKTNIEETLDSEAMEEKKGNLVALIKMVVMKAARAL